MVDGETGPRGGSLQVPVAAAKTVVPQLSAGYLHRPRLVAQLDRAAADAVLLVCAPAGYGKTLLLADWVAADPTRTAWVSLDEDENDDRRFWAAVLAAVLAAPLPPPGSPLHELRLPAVPSRDPDFLPAFLDALHDLPEPVRLVLDDVHELTAADPLHGLACLVRDRPPMLQIVLATRSDPPVHLDRLRLSAQLHEIRAGELAFSFDEASVLMVMMDVGIRDDQVRLVLDQTDGWAAGLRLAALSLRESDDRDAFLTDLVGNGRAISDYLVGEILARLTDEIIDLLTAVCVCDHLTAPLAVALSEQDDAAELLIALERETSLVVSYGDGRRWFRIHPLLRAHLRADVRRRRPDLLCTLEARAARWSADAGDPVGALRHARAAEDPDLTDELLQRHGAALATSGHHHAVVEALDAAAARRPVAGATIELVGALARMELGDAAAAGRHLARAEAVWPAEPTARLTSLRALVEARLTWTSAQGTDPGTAPDGEPADGCVPEHLDLFVRACAALARGDQRLAQQAARAGAERAISDGNGYLAARSLTTLSMAAGMAGDIAGMVELAEQAERSAPADRWRSTEGAVLNAVTRGYGALLQARPEEGLRLADGLLDVTTRPDGPPPVPAGNTLRPMVEMLRAATRFDLGGGPRELDAMRAARLATPARAALQMTAATTALLEHGAAVWLGRADRAREVLRWAEERFGATGEVVLLRAFGPAAMSRFEVAREHLRPLLAGSLAPVVPWALVGGWLLECDIALAVGARPRARDALRRALAAAGEGGVLRPLVYAPPRVAALLEQLSGLGALEVTARAVLAVRWARERAPVLTGRETAVLTLLPTQLSFEEIAGDLGVSVNTVKSHVKAVYGKLGVGSRRSAVGAALANGLIEFAPNH